MTSKIKLIEKSKIMTFFEKLGMEKISWSLRRLHVPVLPSDLVLEVGSGGNPYFRSNVLLDAYVDTRERHHAPLISDRKTVIGVVENLPFKDKTFDFIIASHVLEHTSEPKKFLDELQRVGKAGYIEVPDALMERLNPYIDHRLEIRAVENKLFIKKKKQSIIDLELKKLYESRAKPLIAGYLIPKFPFSFHVRYYWSNQIDYEISNPEVFAGWVSTEDYPIYDKKVGLLELVKRFILSITRSYFSQKKRNKNINMFELIRCPSCKKTNLTDKITAIQCEDCSAVYQVNHGLTHLTDNGTPNL